MPCELVIRRARAEDEAARAALVRRGLVGHFRDAFLLFFFQEATLQCVVLCGAVLFIFAGASLRACAALVPAAAAIVAAAVLLAHLARARAQLQGIRNEMSGWVAEARGEPARVVGTVSLSEFWGPRNSGWVHALAVAPEWRRRGAGRALAGAAAAAAAAAGLDSLEAATSSLQHAARALLHSQGWELRGSYRRPVVGAAVTLHVARLGLELPTP